MARKAKSSDEGPKKKSIYTNGEDNRMDKRKSEIRSDNEFPFHFFRTVDLDFKRSPMPRSKSATG